MGSSTSKVSQRAHELIQLLMKSQADYESELSKHIFDHVTTDTAPASQAASSPEIRLRDKLLMDFLLPGGRFTDRLSNSLLQFASQNQIELPLTELHRIIRDEIDEQVRRYQQEAEQAQSRQFGGSGTTQQEEALQKELQATWNTLEF